VAKIKSRFPVNGGIGKEPEFIIL